MLGYLFSLVWFLVGIVLTLLNFFSGYLGWLTFATFLAVQVAQLVFAFVLPKVFGPQDLAVRYNTKWALVTGASSGIGKAICERLAGQRINVVLVALDNSMLSDTFAEMQKKFPEVSFRKVGVNLGKEGAYMEPIISATSDIHVNLVFNNAGYIVPGFFADQTADTIMENYTCNATCAVRITRHFVEAMLNRKEKGLITFTSSAGGYLPGPTAVMYASTKAFLTSFGASLAGEVKDAGIDIVVMHPSPVQSRFYNTSVKMSSLEMAQKAATSPFTIADQIFASAGRLTIWDQGLVCFVFRVVLKSLDYAFFAEMAARFASMNGDHQQLLKTSKTRRSK